RRQRRDCEAFPHQLRGPRGRDHGEEVGREIVERAHWAKRSFAPYPPETVGFLEHGGAALSLLLRPTALSTSSLSEPDAPTCTGIDEMKDDTGNRPVCARGRAPHSNRSLAYDLVEDGALRTRPEAPEDLDQRGWLAGERTPRLDGLEGKGHLSRWLEAI